jgi:hypothetical protein
MEYLIIETINLMRKISFTPLVLIGLLITSLSLILNLKDTNKFIKKFKEHENIEIFINKIFYASSVLIILFIISIGSHFINISESLSQLSCIFLSILSFLYLIGLLYISYTLFTIVFMLKEIVKTALKDD